MGRDLELDVWRMVGRFIDLDEALPRIVGRLADRTAFRTVAVRRLDLSRQCLETVAATGVPSQVWASPRSDLTPMGEVALVAWARDTGLTRSAPNHPPPLDVCVPSSIPGTVLVGPLADGDGLAGILILSGADGESPRRRDQTLAASLLEPLTSALRNHLRLRDLRHLRESLEADKEALLRRLQRDEIVDSIVGAEAGMRRVIGAVRKVAATDAPVLLLGETGSGKEVVARAIHAQSARHSGPMVRVNCGAIPADLVDSELFGHERGSFTGAVESRKGWFERADGGTLFLDELGELPVAAQVRLLRVLQDGSLERVGGHQSLHVDVRVVAATNADLESLVAAGRFREDLWYRVSVFPIRIPPLRERREDIPALAAHFASRAGRRLAGMPLVPDPGDIALLLAYSWPGNVRELASVIERAAILGDGRRLEVASALGVLNGGRMPGVADVRAFEIGDRGAAVVAPLDKAIARHIESALEACRGRIEGPFGVARLLDVNPHTLRARMRRLGINWQAYREPR